MWLMRGMESYRITGPLWQESTGGFPPTGTIIQGCEISRFAGLNQQEFVQQ